MAMISAPRRSASSTPSRVLPDAVGPVRIKALVNGSGTMAGTRVRETVPSMTADPPRLAKGGRPDEGPAMPHFEDELVVPRPLPEVFDFFLDAHNLTRVSPPELHLRVVQAPPRLQLGSVVEARGRRWGVPQRIVSEVTALEPNVSFVDEQRHGPFGKFVH